MDRRKSIKSLLVGTVATGILVDACQQPELPKNETKEPVQATNEADRMPEEKAYNKKLLEEVFFTPEEMATIGVLSDIIIPRDEVSGSATEAKVPEFIEFIVKDKPEFQVPMRGGLRWLDLYSFKLFDKPFTGLQESQQIQIVDKIAYPQKTIPELKQGASFFTLIRNLTLSGFYTTPMGVKDIGYMGNTPNQWNGVPADVLKQYNIYYSDKELRECISYDKV